MDLVYEATAWYRVFVLMFTAFAFWLMLWLGCFSVSWLIDLVKKSLKQ